MKKNERGPYIKGESGLIPFLLLFILIPIFLGFCGLVTKGIEVVVDYPVDFWVTATGLAWSLGSIFAAGVVFYGNRCGIREEDLQDDY